MASNDVRLSGTICWTDGEGKPHPVRQATVEIWDDDTLLVGGDKKIKTVSTDLSGVYSTTFNNDDGWLQGRRDIYLKILAQSPYHFVQDPKPIIDQTYVLKNSVWKEIPNGSHTLSITIPNTSTIGRAFSVGDAIYTAGRSAEMLRGRPKKLEINFPVKASDSFFEEGGLFDRTDLNITSAYRWSWDMIHHEYGHYLAYLDNLANNPGGNHSRGTSNITGGTTSSGYKVPAHGKDKGVRLAWGEGLSDYLALALQAIAKTNGFLPDVQAVGDTVFDAINADEPSRSFRVDREGNGINAGEGDESSVARILWDLADGQNEPHDKISLGHNTLYDILNNRIANLDQLDDVWDFFFKTSNDATRVDFGAIFEEYDVSPHPFGGAIGKTFQLGDSIPTFQWEKNNNNANDQFQCIVFNNNFSTRVLDYLIPGDVTQWTPTEDQWKQITTKPGKYHFVIAGSDTTTFTTGAYWSGAYDFDIAASSNLVINGDFESGNIGFSSQYPYQQFTPEAYDIGTDPQLWNGAWASFEDHTSGAGENMMIVDGNISGPLVVWQTTVPVSPNINYDFSSWVASTYPESPAQLTFQINGVQVDSTFTASTTPGQWEKFSTTWNSGSNTSATLSIVDVNLEFAGNDFALDDISFQMSRDGASNPPVQKARTRASGKLVGGSNNRDALYDNGGKDALTGKAGNHSICGGSAADTLLSDAGNDTIYGNGDGNFINGGVGFDTNWLGADAATVVLARDKGYNTINNVQLGATQFKVSSLNDFPFADTADGMQIFQGNNLLAGILRTLGEASPGYLIN